MQCITLSLGRLGQLNNDYCVIFHSYSVDATAYNNAHFGQDTSTIIALDDVACTTAESRLIDCTYDTNTSDCSHTEDAGVQCAPRELFPFEV